jgi:ParB family transcriptional regulator, chromosome partitioning protein
MYQEIELKEITPNPRNTRTRFEGQKFDDLVESIRQKGVIEPIIVRPLKKGYELVAGERRFRACLKVHEANGRGATIPALVRKLSDDEAVEFMTIENLQREDLTEIEEARAFQQYLALKGEDAVEDLASRIGVDPRYVRRRVRVLDLPKKALDMWEKRELRYGHLEQLLRLGTKQEVLDIINSGRVMYSVDMLRNEIDRRSPRLDKAHFDTRKAGCDKCANNSNRHRRLFGDDFKTDKALCTSPTCFIRRQHAAITKEWPGNLGKAYGTTGFRWRHDTPWETFEQIYLKTNKKCAGCEKFVSILDIDGHANHERACLDKSCFRGTYRQTSTGTPKREPGESPNWHGTFFREEFYKKAIPRLYETVHYDDYTVLHVALAAILQQNSEARSAFFGKLSGSGRSVSDHIDMTQLWPHIEVLTAEQTKEAIKDATLNIVLQGTRPEGTHFYSQGHQVSPELRHVLAAHLGIDLEKSWTLNEEYLKKKTVAEILAIGRNSNSLADSLARPCIFDDEKAKLYLAGTLKKARPESCKKTELIDLILKSGVDLSGRVPDEILKVKP